MYKEKSSPVRTFPCPSCGEFIAVGAPSCRHCSAPVDDQAAAFAAADFQRVQDAVTKANTLKLTSMLAVGFILADPIFVLLSDDLNRAVRAMQFLPAGAIVATAGWLVAYGRLETTDRDYPEAVRAIKRTLGLWLVALVVQIAALAAYSQRG